MLLNRIWKIFYVRLRLMSVFWAMNTKKRTLPAEPIVKKKGLNCITIPETTAFQAPDSEKKSQKKKTEKTRSEEHTSELQSRPHLVCRLLLEKKKKKYKNIK